MVSGGMGLMNDIQGIVDKQYNDPMEEEYMKKMAAKGGPTAEEEALALQPGGLLNMKPEPKEKPLKVVDLLANMKGGGGAAGAGMKYAQAQQMQPQNMMGMMQGLMSQKQPQRQNVPMQNFMSLMGK